MPLQDEIKAFTFDVFGTVVDWCSSVEAALRRESERKMQSAGFASVPSAVQSRVKAMTAADWAAFAQEWRNAYGQFTHGFVKGETPWKDVDTHHRESLVELLEHWQLAGLYSDEEVERLSKTWHYLDPWDDSSVGLHKLGTRFVTATLSNGNQALLRDLNDHGNLGFKRLISGEDFGAYKPSPAVYLGACEALGLKPAQVAMVAAHLGDLAGARSCGLRTVYVERPGEEGWKPDEEQYQMAREWVDIWVPEGEGGFVEVARRLGIS